MVRNQEPKEADTRAGNVAERYWRRPWAINPVVDYLVVLTGFDCKN